MENNYSSFGLVGFYNEGTDSLDSYISKCSENGVALWFNKFEYFDKMKKKDLIKKGDDIIMFSRGGCERYYRVGIDGKLCGSDGIILDKGKRNLDIWGMRDVERVLERLQLSKFI